MDSDHCILLVEDSADDVKLLKRAMRKAAVSCPVHIVADGDKAIEYLDGAGAYADRHAFPLPTLVLLDLKLPRRSGFEVLEYLRAHAMLKKTIVVVLTGSSESRDIANAYTRGANSYLVKPIKPGQMDHLVNCVKEYWLDTNRPPPVFSPA
ncbi:MAG: response regulator [Betaproteobacteria bacterium]|nr:MAG: response regulator [Betaproteobacteria bacterium]